MNSSLRASGFSEKRFNTGKVVLNYAVSSSNGPSLLLIPGQSATWENYEKVLPILSKDFKVYAVDVRGHGESSKTPGRYNFNLIGDDFTRFIKGVIKSPVVISGNSSGGLIALWLAVNKTDLVRGIILEDAPLFSADWPRIKKEFVYEVLDKTAKYLGGKDGPDYYAFFKSISRPLKNGKNVELPDWLCKVLAWLLKNQETRIGRIIRIILPYKLRALLEIIPSFDPDFSRAWVDGRIYKGLNHAAALKKIKLPLLIIHADWYRTKKGLVGAMDDSDAKRALELAPRAEYIRIHTEHVTHSSKPVEFAEIVKNFYRKIRKKFS